MVQISEGDDPVKVPLTYYDKHGERHVVGDAAVQIKNGEVIAVGKIESEVEGDIIRKEILGGVNLESFSISAGPFLAPYSPSPADVAAQRLSSVSLEHKVHVTDTNPNGAVRQCDRRDLHEPHEYQAEFGAYFNVYCPGNEGSNR